VSLVFLLAARLPPGIAGVCAAANPPQLTLSQPGIEKGEGCKTPAAFQHLRFSRIKVSRSANPQCRMGLNASEFAPGKVRHWLK
jgi:hypothetical protein